MGRVGYTEIESGLEMDAKGEKQGGEFPYNGKAWLRWHYNKCLPYREEAVDMKFKKKMQLATYPNCS